MENTLPQDVWHVRGSEDGPVVVVMGGTHGDERIGIEVVRRLCTQFGLASTGKADRHIRGELYLVLGNPAAIEKGTRAAADGPDLNRSFNEIELSADASPEDRPDLVRARELAPLLAKADFLIDLHCTSTDSPPFVCMANGDGRHERLYRHLDIAYALSDPNGVLAQDEPNDACGTTDEYVEAFGGTAICYETGQGDDLSRVDAVFDEVLAMLCEIGTLDGLAQGGKGPKDGHVYRLTHNVPAKQASFTYAKTMGVGWTPVRKGELIGTYPDGTEERAPASGILLFQRHPERVIQGKCLFYIAE